jgi:P-type Cu2+ transporter
MSEERLTLPLRGLTSAACVCALERVMREQEGVIWATVNFAAEEANIVYDPATFDLARLAKVVNEQRCAVVLGVAEITSLRSTLPIHRRRLQPEILWRAWRS